MSLAVRLCELRTTSAWFVTDGNESHWVEDFMADAEEIAVEEGSVPPALHRGISSQALVPHEEPGGKCWLELLCDVHVGSICFVMFLVLQAFMEVRRGLMPDLTAQPVQPLQHSQTFPEPPHQICLALHRQRRNWKRHRFKNIFRVRQKHQLFTRNS